MPPELRAMIWENVLAADKGMDGPDGTKMISIGVFPGGFYDDQPPYLTTAEWCKQPPITQVSRLIRAETLPIYYSNTFVIHVEHRKYGPSSMKYAYDWLTDMGEANRGLLKSLQVRWCPSADSDGLTRKRLCSVLAKAGLTVPYNAVTTLIPRGFPEPHEVHLWDPVSDAEDDRDTRADKRAEKDLLGMRSYPHRKPYLPFSWGANKEWAREDRQTDCFEPNQQRRGEGRQGRAVGRCLTER